MEFRPDNMSLRLLVVLVGMAIGWAAEEERARHWLYAALHTERCALMLLLLLLPKGAQFLLQNVYYIYTGF